MAGKRKGKEKKANVWDQNKNKKLKAKDGDPNNNNANVVNGNYNEWQLRSEPFNNYYKSMGICKDDVEFETMIKTMQKPLPTTFRINTTIGPIKKLVQDQLNEIIKDVSSVDKNELALSPEDLDGEGEFEMATPIPWFPNEIAWKSCIPRKLFRKVPTLKKFKSFLVNHNEQGYITRQEAVSMIPPLFLDVQPNHCVLDMCAAPGSKTTQIIEELHLKEMIENEKNSNNGGVTSITSNLPTGCVIANDVDAARCYLLVHNTQRLDTIAVAVTNHEAQNYPIPFMHNSETGERTPIFFDRILCDVPCSGDGTTRKNPEVWREWKEINGTNLSVLQIKIATRACHLLKVGGRMVYSTCSLNPAENEAVVAELLLKSNGAMKLVDVSKELPHLIRAPGLETYPNSPYTPEQYKSLNLQHCLRIHPHFQDTGGFFVTVLEKVSEMPNQLAKRKSQQEQEQDKEYLAKVNNNFTETSTETSTETTEPSTEPSTETSTEPSTNTNNNNNNNTQQKQQSFYHNERKLRENDKRLGGQEDPFCKLNEETKKEFESIKEFYGISNEFPFEQLLGRSDKPKKLYFVSKSLCQIISNDFESRKFKIINCGIKVFLKHEQMAGSDCKWRISQESVNVLSPFITKRSVTINHAELVLLLKFEPFFDQFPPEVTKQLLNLSQGCFILAINNNVDSLSHSMTFAAWRGKTSVHLLVSKQEIQSLKGIFGIPDNKPQNPTTTTTTTTITEVNTTTSEPQQIQPEKSESTSKIEEETMNQ